jgi:hypothetical protein
MDKISAGIKNGRGWGLVWSPGTSEWKCFSCGMGFYNRACGDSSVTDEQCSMSFAEGACAPAECNDKYQIRQSDGKCYTKWCRNIPDELGVAVGGPLDKDCSGVPSHPFMAYNSEDGWDCAYCTRAPPETLK